MRGYEYEKARRWWRRAGVKQKNPAEAGVG
jgi:hypothetical protein